METTRTNLALAALAAAFAACQTLPVDTSPGNLARIYAVDASQHDVLVWSNGSVTAGPARDTQFGNNQLPLDAPADDLDRVSPMPATYTAIRVEFTKPLSAIFPDGTPNGGLFEPRGKAIANICQQSPNVAVTDTPAGGTMGTAVNASTCYRPSSAIGGGPSILITLGKTGPAKNTFTCSRFLAGGVNPGDKLTIKLTNLADVDGNAIPIDPITVTVGGLDLLYAGYSDPDQLDAVSGVGFTKFFIKGQNAKGFLKDVHCDVGGDLTDCVGTSPDNGFRSDLSQLDLVFSTPLDIGGAMGDPSALGDFFDLLDSDNSKRPVPGQWGGDNSDPRIVHFFPNAGLLEGAHNYALKIHKSTGAPGAMGTMAATRGTPVTDVLGNKLGGDYALALATSAPGITPLSMTETDGLKQIVPDANSINVDPRAAVGLDTGGHIDLLFPLAVNSVSVGKTLHLLDGGGHPVPACTGASTMPTSQCVDVWIDDGLANPNPRAPSNPNANANAQIVHIQPALDLARETTYTVAMTGATYDSSIYRGTAIPDVSSPFTTAALQAIALQCSEIGACAANSLANPVNADSQGTPITAFDVAFNGNLDPATVNGNNIALWVKGATKPIVGQTITAAAQPDHVTIKLSSSAPLVYSTTYQLRASTKVTEQKTGAKVLGAGCTPTPADDCTSQVLSFTTTDFKVSGAGSLGDGSALVIVMTGSVDPTSLGMMTSQDPTGKTENLSFAVSNSDSTRIMITAKAPATLMKSSVHSVLVTGVKAAKLGSADPMVTAPPRRLPLTVAGCP